MLFIITQVKMMWMEGKFGVDIIPFELLLRLYVEWLEQ